MDDIIGLDDNSAISVVVIVEQKLCRCDDPLVGLALWGDCDWKCDEAGDWSLRTRLNAKSTSLRNEVATDTMLLLRAIRVCIGDEVERRR